MREVSWQILVKFDIPFCNPRVRFVVYILVGHMIQIYDSDLIYGVVKKDRTLHYGDATDCMLKLVELRNSHRSKGGVFEMPSDNGGHRSSSRKCPVHYKNCRFPSWDCW